MKLKFFRYIAQSVSGMIGISIYILADTFFISKSAGGNGLTVLNLALPIFGMMFAIGAMIGIGSATRYTIDKASGRNVENYFWQSVIVSIGLSIPFVLIGAFAADNVLAFFGGDTTIVELGTPYLKIVMLGAPAFITNYTFTSFARNEGATKIAMIGSLGGSVFNIVFDYIFIFPVGMGINGAALATAISPIVTILICTTYYVSNKNKVGLKFGKVRMKHILKCAALGISSFMSELSSAVTTIVFNTLLLGIAGNTGVAAYGIVANFSLVGMAIFNGIAQGAQPLISESYGKGEHDKTKKYLYMGIGTALAIAVIVVIGIYLFTDECIELFNSEHDMVLRNYAFDAIRIYILGCIFAGINIMYIGYLAATEKVVGMVIGSLLRGVIAISLCAIILSKIIGINGIWMSLIVSEIITLLVQFCLDKYYVKS